MADKFIPPDKNLDPIQKLLTQITVTDQSVTDAIEDWKKEPPDDKFKEILEAEINES